MAGEPDSTAEPAAAAFASTGDARVDAIVARIREVDTLPPAGQVPVFEEVHDALRTLLDSAAQPTTGAPPATGTGQVRRTQPETPVDTERPGRSG